MTLTLQFITVVDKVNSVVGTLTRGAYATDTTFCYCCREVA